MAKRLTVDPVLSPSPETSHNNIQRRTQISLEVLVRLVIVVFFFLFVSLSVDAHGITSSGNG